MNKTIAIATMIGFLAGVISGWWFHGQVLSAQQQALMGQIMGPPRIIQLDPGTPMVPHIPNEAPKPSTTSP
jgi:hypothetical protein